MKKWISGMLLAITIAFAGIAMPVKAEEAASSGATVSAVNPITNETITTTNSIVNLDLEYKQTEAREALKYINEFRTSKEDAWAWDSTNTKIIKYENLTPLQYDYGLEKVAMQRAAELAILYTHIRPTGESCFTAFPNGEFGSKAENCAANANAISTVIALREDNKPYETQGHRRTMLNPELLYVGIGHVIYNGQHWWALEYMEKPTNSQCTEPVDGSLRVPIEFKNLTEEVNNGNSYAALNLGLDLNNNAGYLRPVYKVGIGLNETFSLSDMPTGLFSWGGVINYVSQGLSVPIKAPYTITDITSSNPEIVKGVLNSETSSYEIQAVSAGEAEITIYLTFQSSDDLFLPSPIEVESKYTIVVCDHARVVCNRTGNQYHEKKCLDCLSVRIEEHAIDYEYNNGLYHSKYCTKCKYFELNQEHVPDENNICTLCNGKVSCKHEYTKENITQYMGEWTITRICNKCGNKARSFSKDFSFTEETLDCTSRRCRISTIIFYIDGKRCEKVVREEGYFPPAGHNFIEYTNNNKTHTQLCIKCGATGNTEVHNYNQNNLCNICGFHKEDESAGENPGGTATSTTPTPIPPSNIPVPGGNENGGGTANTVPGGASNDNSTNIPSSSQIKVGKTELSQIINTNAGIELIWNKANNTTSYIVYRRISNKGWTKIATVNSNVTKYTDKAVKSKNGTFYGYRIQTVNKGKTGEYSKEKNIYRLTEAKLTSAKNNKAKKAVIKWKKASKIDGYEIQYSTSKNFKKAATKKINSASKKEYTISKLKKGKTYYIKLRTYKTVNKKKFYSAWSSTKKVKIKK